MGGYYDRSEEKANSPGIICPSGSCTYYNVEDAMECGKCHTLLWYPLGCNRCSKTIRVDPRKEQNLCENCRCPAGMSKGDCEHYVDDRRDAVMLQAQYQYDGVAATKSKMSA